MTPSLDWVRSGGTSGGLGEDSNESSTLLMPAAVMPTGVTTSGGRLRGFLLDGMFPGENASPSFCARRRLCYVSLPSWGRHRGTQIPSGCSRCLRACLDLGMKLLRL